MKKSDFILLLTLAASAVGYSQATEFVVRKTSSEFSYNNKPITPEAIQVFLPGWETWDTVRPNVVNLRDSAFTLEVFVDTNKGMWFRCDLGPYIFSGSVVYKIVGKTKDNKFVILASWKGVGTLVLPYVFVFTLTGDKIFKVGYFLAESLSINPDEIIEIKEDEIINGSIRYKIPN